MVNFIIILAKFFFLFFTIFIIKIIISPNTSAPCEVTEVMVLNRMPYMIQISFCPLL